MIHEREPVTLNPALVDSALGALPAYDPGSLDAAFRAALATIPPSPVKPEPVPTAPVPTSLVISTSTQPPANQTPIPPPSPSPPESRAPQSPVALCSQRPDLIADAVKVAEAGTDDSAPRLMAEDPPMPTHPQSFDPEPVEMSTACLMTEGPLFESGGHEPEAPTEQSTEKETQPETKASLSEAEERLCDDLVSNSFLDVYTEILHNPTLIQGSEKNQPEPSPPISDGVGSPIPEPSTTSTETAVPPIMEASDPPVVAGTEGPEPGVLSSDHEQLQETQLPPPSYQSIAQEDQNRRSPSPPQHQDEIPSEIPTPEDDYLTTEVEVPDPIIEEAGEGGWGMGASSRPLGFAEPDALDDLDEDELNRYLTSDPDLEMEPVESVTAPAPPSPREAEMSTAPLSRSSSASSSGSQKRVRFAEEMQPEPQSEETTEQAVPNTDVAGGIVQDVEGDAEEARVESAHLPPTEQEQDTFEPPDPQPVNQEEDDHQAPPPASEAEENEGTAMTVEESGRVVTETEAEVHEEPRVETSMAGGMGDDLTLPSTEDIVNEGMAGLGEDIPPLTNDEDPALELEGPNRVVPEGTELTEDTPVQEEETPTTPQEDSVPEAEDAPRPSVVASTHEFGPTLESFRLTESELQLGKSKPAWIPDNEAPTCMLCQTTKFSMIHRRHHCRACGRVLCSSCCNLKATLPYLQPEAKTEKDAIARVCEPCSGTLQRIRDFERERQEAEDANLALALSLQDSDPDASPSPTPTHIISCRLLRLRSTGSIQVEPVPTGPVPASRGLLRQPDASRNSSRRVVFGFPSNHLPEKETLITSARGCRDGSRPGETSPETAAPSTPSSAPGGEGAEASSSSSGSGTSPRSGTSGGGTSGRRRPRQPSRRQSRAALSAAAELESFLTGAAEVGGPAPPGLLPDGADWPLVVAEGLRHRAEPPKLMSQMTDPEAPPVEFAIKRNLTANIKIVKRLRCVAQDEILILLRRQPNEDRPPFDILRLFNALYEEALQGNRVSEMEHTVVGAISGLHFGPGGFLGSQDHAGLLYIRPSLQCMEGGLPSPDQPFLVGLLLLKSEVPWAKVLPLRLLLRLGAEAKVYPCPVVSERFRTPVYEEIGQTIMNLLADFRNYSYSLPWLPGSRVELEDGRTTLCLPRSRLRTVFLFISQSERGSIAETGLFELVRVIEASRQAGSVVAWAADLNTDADSHLVAVQSNGQYRTQTINIQGRDRRATGGGFVVMSGALRAAAGVEAKTSIVEDGVMLQVRPDHLDAILNNLKAGEDYELDIDNAEQKTLFQIKWTDDSLTSATKNRGYRSPIDARKLEGLPCLKVSGKIADHSHGGQLLRMTELFVIASDLTLERLEELQGELLTLGRHLTTAAAKALLPFASELAATGLRTLGVRVTLGPDEVEFSSGAGGQALPEPLVPGLDAELVPLLYSQAASHPARLSLELILRILDL